MNQQANAAAAGGIDDGMSNEALRAELATAKAQLAKHKETQLADHHNRPGTANESHPSSKVRYAIMIEEGRDDNDMNPVYVGVNGRGYSIKRGQIVEVPKEVLSVLDTAVESRSTPRTDANGIIAGFNTREARRFPYRNYGKIVDENGERTNVVLPEANEQ